IGGGGHDDAVERRLFLPALRAVRDFRSDVVDAQCMKARFGFLEQRLEALDSVDAPRQLCQGGGLIGGAGAALQYLVDLLDLQGFGHQGHDLRLADGLALRDGERLILVGLVVEMRQHELLARNALERRQHARIRDARAAQVHDEADLARLQAHPAARLRAGLARAGAASGNRSPISRKVAACVESQCSGVTATIFSMMTPRSVFGSLGSSVGKSPIHSTSRPYGSFASFTCVCSRRRPWGATLMPVTSSGATGGKLTFIRIDCGQ